MKIIGSERIFISDYLLSGESRLFKSIREKIPAFFSSGRSSIYGAFKNEIKAKAVFFPDFYCEEMLKPIIKSGTDVVFYSINKNMTAELDVFEKIKNIKTVYINDYCGFRDNKLFELAKKKKMKIVIDRTHSMFSDFDFSGNLQIASLRKMFPLPDGGIILNGKHFNSKRERDASFYRDKINAKVFRFIYEEFSDDKNTEMNYVSLSEKSEKNIKINAKNISLFSEKFFSAYDADSASKKRRKNYSTLISYPEIRERAVFKKLDAKTVPQSLPILVSNRDSFKAKLAEEKIFAPVLWRCSNPVSESILNLPVDEEYSENDMKRMAGIICKILKGR